MSSFGKSVYFFRQQNRYLHYGNREFLWAIIINNSSVHLCPIITLYTFFLVENVGPSMHIFCGTEIILKWTLYGPIYVMHSFRNVLKSTFPALCVFLIQKGNLFMCRVAQLCSGNIFE